MRGNLSVVATKSQSYLFGCHSKVAIEHAVLLIALSMPVDVKYVEVLFDALERTAVQIH